MASHGITRITRSRTEEQRQQDLEKIKKYRDLEDQIREQVEGTDYTDPGLLQLTTKILRLNPEYYTIWNVRRRCLISGSLSKRCSGSWRSRAWPSTSASGTTRRPSDACLPSSSGVIPSDRKSQTVPENGRSGITAEHDDDQNTETAIDGSDGQKHPAQESEKEQERKDIASDTQVLQSELTFTIPLLLEFPKCYWLWDYRRFLLQLAIDILPAETARQIWLAELALDSKMLTKDRRNFHAWGYRRYVVNTLESPELKGTSMAEQEFEYTTKMIRADLSNFSAWHHRSRLAVRILNERGADAKARKRFLEDELALAREGINVGPEDQSLWYYHQFLISQITNSVGRPTIVPMLTTVERVTYVEREIEEIRDLLEDYEDAKWIYEALLEYSLALEGISEGDPHSKEVAASREEMRGWLQKLRELDPMHNGRWNDIEKMLNGKVEE